MKLFIWKDYQAGRSANGVAFALAETVEQARELIVQFETEGGTGRFSDSMREMTTAQVGAEPDLIIDTDSPFAMTVWGGD